MAKKLILATLAGAVVQFLLGWLVYGVLLMSFMSNHTTHYEGLMKDMNTASFMILVFISGLVMAFLISYIFQRWAKFETFMKGLNGGLFLGFFLALTYDLYFLASMNMMDISGMIVDIISSTITMGILGGVIGWILGMKSKAA